MDKEIFTLIDNPEEKAQLFQDLANARGELLCKGNEETLVKIRAESYSAKPQYLYCASESTNKLANGEQFLGYFFLGGEKYYFEGTIIAFQSKYSMALPASIYRLQRRQNYRAKVPNSYVAMYNIVSVNGAKENIHGKIADISSQGCRVIYSMENPLMKIGDNVTGQMTMGARSPFEIQGIVRHIKVDEGNNVIQTFGIEFTKMPTITESKLFSITMELYKEFFKRS